MFKDEEEKCKRLEEELMTQKEQVHTSDNDKTQLIEVQVQMMREHEKLVRSQNNAQVNLDVN